METARLVAGWIAIIGMFFAGVWLMVKARKKYLSPLLPSNRGVWLMAGIGSFFVLFAFFLLVFLLEWNPS